MNKFLVINFIVFQLCWLVAATYQQDGIAILTALLAIHFIFSPTKNNDVKVLFLVLIGCTVDQILLVFGVIEFNGMPPVIPFWLILLWYGFILCLNHSLQWVIHAPIVLQIILGSVFGSLSYYLALQLDAFSTNVNIEHFVIILSVVWAVLLPLLSLIHKKTINLNTTRGNNELC